MGMKARANVATFFKYFVLILMGFIMVYPLLWMVGSTFKTNAEIFTSLSPFTAHPTLDGYYNAVTKTYGGDITIWRAFLNTYSYVIPKVVFTVISSVIAAYGFSRFKFKGRDFLFGVMIMTLFLPQVVLNVPQYMMYNKFDWINNPLYPALWVPSLFATETYFVYQLVQFMRSIPHDLDEAAAIDGIKNRWQELWYVTLPAMKPQLMFGAVMQITQSFAVADISINLAGNPSVNYAGATIVTHLLDYGSTRMEMGYACAIATILFLLMVGTNKLVQRVLRRVGE